MLEGSVAVTNRRLKQSVLLTDGQGVDITPTDTSRYALPRETNPSTSQDSNRR